MTSQDKPLSVLSEQLRRVASRLERKHDNADAMRVELAVERIAALESLLARRTEALVKYGRHDFGCALMAYSNPAAVPCTCGFAEAMGEQK